MELTEKAKAKEKENARKKVNKYRRKNAVLYPLYKAFSWDLLCYYSIEYLFLTITKGITPGQVLVSTAIYAFAKVIFEIPIVIFTEYVGKRKRNLFVLHRKSCVRRGNHTILHSDENKRCNRCSFRV